MTSTLQSTGNTKFLETLNTLNLGALSDAAGQITIFAPNDPAFVNKPPLDTSAVKYHTVSGTALYSTLLVDGAEFKTDQGLYIYINIVRGVLSVNCIPIKDSDLLASGGVVHTIDQVWDSKLPRMNLH